MPSPKEQQLLKDIAEIEVDQKDARARVAFHKKAAVDAESDLIYFNLNREKLVEQLRRVRLETVKHEIGPRDIEIKRLREVLPELLKKIK